MATRNECAEHLFLSTTQFDNLRRQGVMPTPRGRAAYDVDLCRRAYIEWLKSKKPRSTEDTASKPDPKNEIDLEKLRKLRIENQRLTRELVPAVVLKKYAERLGSTVHDAMQALPGLIKTRIPHLRAAEVTMIKAELAKAQNAIVQFDPDHESAA